MASYNSYVWNGPGFPCGPNYSSTPNTSGSQAQTQQADKPSGSETDYFNVEVKILNSQNKREFHLFTLRYVSSDLIDSPEKLCSAVWMVSTQHGSWILSPC